jgi:hypothetical protein
MEIEFESYSSSFEAEAKLAGKEEFEELLCRSVNKHLITFKGAEYLRGL